MASVAPKKDHAISTTMSMPISLYEKMMKQARKKGLNKSAYIQRLIEADQ